MQQRRKPFEPKAEISKATEALLVRLREMKRGEVITYAEIEKLTGIPQDRVSYRTTTENARRELLAEKGIALEAIATVGYRLMTVQTQAIEAPIRRERKVISQRRKAKRELFGVLPEVVDPAEQKRLKTEFERQEEELREAKNHARFLKAMRPAAYGPHRTQEDD